MQYNQISLSVFTERLNTAMATRINAFINRTLQNIKDGKHDTLLSAQEWAKIYSEWSGSGASLVDIEITKYLSH